MDAFRNERALNFTVIAQLQEHIRHKQTTQLRYTQGQGMFTSCTGASQHHQSAYLPRSRSLAASAASSGAGFFTRSRTRCASLVAPTLIFDDGRTFRHRRVSMEGLLSMRGRAFPRPFSLSFSLTMSTMSPAPCMTVVAPAPRETCDYT